MERAEKAVAVEALKGVFASSGSVVVAHYTGLTVAEMTSLRGRMRDVGAQVKVVKNRLHLDVHVSGGAGPTDRSVPLATRTQRVDAEARRLADLGATITGALSADGLDHYAAGMKDPEGNEFDIN